MKKTLALPKEVLYGERFKKLDAYERLAYIALLDKFDESIRKGVVDDKGRVYCHCPIRKVATEIGVAKRTANYALIGLKEKHIIDVEKVGRTNRYYIKEI